MNLLKKVYVGNCWPNQEKLLLLKAGLLEESLARKAWHQYCLQVDIQTIDHISHAFLPLVYRNLQTDERFPQAMQSCKSVYRYIWTFNNLQIFQFGKTLQVLTEKKISVTLLKGLALIARYYKDPGLRVMGDIDLLVTKENFFNAYEILNDLGWRSEGLEKKQMITPALLADFHGVILTHANQNRLDLHQVLWEESLHDPAMSGLNYQTCESIFFHTQLFINMLKPEDQLLHIIFHGIKDSPEPLIRWIADATILLKQEENFNWEYFLQQAKTAKIFIFVQRALLYLHIQQFFLMPLFVLTALENYKPHKNELKYYCYRTSKHSAPLMHAGKSLWYRHLRNKPTKNFFALLLTFPDFLKNYWQLPSSLLLPILGIKKLFKFYFERASAD